ncbi:MAG: flagellar hook-length control protein FliK [Campylobacterales bacterium]|nr:flagellar hook-length control protein FliK [Campylobacterales bacterium]
MPNIINSLLSSETTTTANTTSSTSEQTVKDKPSFFDSLLSNNTVTKEEDVTAKKTAITTPVKEVKIEEKLSGEDLEINPEIKVDNIQLENIEIEVEKVTTGKIEEQKTTSTTSLLDRLIIEAKKNVKETIVPEEMKQNSDISITTKKNSLEVESTNNKDNLIIPKENIVTNNLGIKDIVDIVIPTEIKQDLDTPIIPKENIPQILISEEIKQNLDTLIIPKENSNSSDLNIKTKEQKVNSTDILLEQIVTKTQNGVSTQEVVSSDIKVITENETLNPILNSSMDLNTDNLSNVKESPLLSLPITTTEVVEENGVKQESLVIKKEEKLSLMDQLILKNNEKLTLNTIDSNIPAPLKDIVTKDLISSIYLGSQKNKINSQALFNRNEAVNLLKDGNSIQAVKTSAEILELGLEDMSIEQNIDIDKIEVKKSDIQALSRKNQIDNLFFDKNVKSEEVKNLITQSIEASSALLDNSLNLADDATITVNSPLSFNIQSKIIGAKQQMSTMMSDIAKQMYENYKPPMTAFRININPLELGSIAILMKNDRNNGLTISMNVTNNVTLNTLIENQNMLRTSLNKTFDDATNFNLDFSSSNQNSSNQSSNANQGQGNNRRFEQQMDTQSVLQLKEENRDIEEKSIDYM